MLIVLTGLRPTLWFAESRGSDRGTYRKFLFARVVHAGKPLICAMCVITRSSPDRNWLIDSHTTFIVRELGLGLSPVRYHGVGVATANTFENVRTARAYAIKWAWQTLRSQQSQALLLLVAEMYDESHYNNWEVVCL